jgi:hypothetical protein
VTKSLFKVRVRYRAGYGGLAMTNIVTMPVKLQGFSCCALIRHPFLVNLRLENKP